MAEPSVIAAELVAAERARDPEVVRLARLLSIAARVEAELIRAMRLAVLPRAGAEIEADLWFSPLVQARDPEGLALLPDVADLLQRELSEPAHAADLAAAWDVIASAHARHSPLLVLEESATYTALTRTADGYRSMERELGRAFAALEGSTDDVIPKWVARTLPRLPAIARASEPALALARTAERRLARVRVRGVLDVGEPEVAWHPGLLRALPTTKVGVRLLAAGIELTHPVGSDTTIILEAPSTNPLVIEVATPSAQGWTARREVLLQESTTTVDVAVGPLLRITNAAGDEVSLRPGGRGRSPVLLVTGLGDMRPTIEQEAEDLGWVVVPRLKEVGGGAIDELTVDACVVGAQAEPNDLIGAADKRELLQVAPALALVVSANGIERFRADDLGEYDDTMPPGAYTDAALERIFSRVGYSASPDERQVARALRAALIELDVQRAARWVQRRLDDLARPAADVPPKSETQQKWDRLVPKPRPLAAGERYTVFLSYRSANRPWVRKLYDVLRHYGHTVFFDQVELLAGEDLITRLEQALDASQAAVMVWSGAAQDSDWARYEYQNLETRGLEAKNFRFIPLTLDRAPLPVFARNRIFIDFHEYPDGPDGGGLLRLLHAVVGQPLSSDAAQFADELDEEYRKTAAQISASIRNADRNGLLALLNGEASELRSSALACMAVEGLVKLGAYAEALDALERVQRAFPRALRPRQLAALALTRRSRTKGWESDLDQAQAILGELYERGERDPETIGMYGQTWAERYRRSGRIDDLKQSRDLYAEAFEATPDNYYTGINAASKSVLIGGEEELARGRAIAAEVQKIVGTEPTAGDYWKTATAAEALLIQRSFAQAARLYDVAVSMTRTEVASHESTWRQACALMASLGLTDGERAQVRRAFTHLPDCEPPAASDRPYGTVPPRK